MLREQADPGAIAAFTQECLAKVAPTPFSTGDRVFVKLDAPDSSWALGTIDSVPAAPPSSSIVASESVLGRRARFAPVLVLYVMVSFAVLLMINEQCESTAALSFGR